MTEYTDPNDYYPSFQHKKTLDTNQITNINRTLSTKEYLNRLLKLQTINTLILFTSIALQAIAMSTADWFNLNVNEFIQTAKGGLWHYCYARAATMGRLDCIRYEELPNYFVFANNRLFDSRVLIMCSSGFLFVVFAIDLFGILSLYLSEKKGCDIIDSCVARRSRKYDVLQEPTRAEQTSTPTLQAYKINREMITSTRTLSSSAPSTTSSRVVLKPHVSIRTTKPSGYFAYLAVSLLAMVGSVMEFVLKVSGFALFDAYITNLLNFNRVFMAFRSWSYWLMVGAIFFDVLYWIVKVLFARYVLSLTNEFMKGTNSVSNLTQGTAPLDTGTNTHKRQHEKQKRPGYPHNVNKNIAYIPRIDSDSMSQIQRDEFEINERQHKIHHHKHYYHHHMPNHKYKIREYSLNYNPTNSSNDYNTYMNRFNLPKVVNSMENSFEDEISVTSESTIPHSAYRNDENVIQENTGTFIRCPSYPYVYRF